MTIDRPQECNTLLSWLMTNLSTTQSISFRREDLAAQLGINIGSLQKSLYDLIERGYIEYNSRRNGAASSYRILKDLSGITGQQLSQWITERQRVADQSRQSRRKQEQRELAQLRGPELSASTTTPVLEVSVPIEVATEQPMTVVPGPALSPIQQLLKQAQELAEAEEKRAAEEVKPGADLTGMETRLDSMEGKVNALVGFFEQAAKTLRGLAPVRVDQPPVSEPVPEPTTRAQLVRLVNSFAAADRKSEHDTWKYLYGQFDMRTGFNAYAQTPNRVRDQSYLSVIEERGQIDTLYDLAKKLLVLSALK